MEPEPTPTLPISIYPETWDRANEYLNNAFGIGFDEIVISFAIFTVVSFAIIYLIKKLKQN